MFIYIFISFLFLIISTILSRNTKLNLILLPIFWLIFFLISDIYIVSNYFTGRGIDESVIYHFSYGFDGVGIKSNMFIIIIGTCIFFLGILASYLSHHFIKNEYIKFKRNIFISIISFFIIFISFLIHPISKNILELNGYYINNYFGENINLITKGIKSNVKFEDYYYAPELKEANPNNKNLIFIYLESFENLYLDEELFPGLSNGLNQLKEEGIYFNNIKQGYGAARTIAGMVGSQCGLPLITSGVGGNSMHGIDSFLPGAKCMGDYLKNAGYNLNYMGGASLDFAGKGSFYKTHGFNSIMGKEKLVQELDNKNNLTDWGMYDDDLFDLAYQKYEKLAVSDEKFGLFILSMDTHGSEGVKSKKCNNLEYSNDKKSILNSYYCTDYLINDLVKKIRNNKSFKNTSIVIASDHLAMINNNSIDILQKKEEERRILFLILDSENKEKKVISKNGSTLDIGASVLSNIGFNIDQLGLGFNLLSNTGSTITDKNPNIIFSRWKDKYESFWNYPSIKNGISIDLKNKKINIDHRSLKIPALINFNNNLEIEKIEWADFTSTSSLYESINKKIDSILIDYCKNMQTDYKFEETNFCIQYNSKKGAKLRREFNKDVFISVNNIKNIFGN